MTGSMMVLRNGSFPAENVAFIHGAKTGGDAPQEYGSPGIDKGLICWWEWIDPFVVADRYTVRCVLERSREALVGRHGASTMLNPTDGSSAASRKNVRDFNGLYIGLHIRNWVSVFCFISLGYCAYLR